jgi:hypothetical protein
MKREDIIEICEQYDITNYTINEDGSIDVDSSVCLNNRGLTKLPLKFRNVSGYFYCYNNQLTSLEGAPSHVGGEFLCHKNQLVSLEGAPSQVGGDFFCHNNQLVSLEGAPNHVDDNFSCQNNQLTTLEGAPIHVGGGFFCDDNQLVSLKGAPIHVGDIYCDNYLFEEMIDLTKPLNKSRKEYREEVINNYKEIYKEDWFIEYFKPIFRQEKLKQLGI